MNAATPTPTVSVSVNGEAREVPGGLTLDRLVATLSKAPAGVAAAVNEIVVPRTQWPTTRSATATASRCSPRSREADPQT